MTDSEKELTIKLLAAWETLGDDDSRKEYDKMLEMMKKSENSISTHKYTNKVDISKFEHIDDSIRIACE